MYFLLLETSSKKPFIALSNKDRLIDYKYLDYKKLFSDLYPGIDELFKKNNVTVKDLEFIGLGTGPGSYTGIRLGASIAKSMSYGLNIPIISYCSLKAFIPKENGYFLSISDARSGGVYILQGQKQNDQIQYTADPKTIPKQELQDLLTKFLVITDCNANFQNSIIETAPDLEHLTLLLYKKYLNKNLSFYDNLNLLYLKNPKGIVL